TPTSSGADAAKLSRPRSRHAFIAIGCRSRGRVNSRNFSREFLPVSEIEGAQKSPGKFQAINLPIYSHGYRNGAVPQVHGKILAALIYVNSDADHSDMPRFVLRAHLHQYARDLAPVKLNIVW